MEVSCAESTQQDGSREYSTFPCFIYYRNCASIVWHWDHEHIKKLEDSNFGLDRESEREGRGFWGIWLEKEVGETTKATTLNTATNVKKYISSIIFERNTRN